MVNKQNNKTDHSGGSIKIATYATLAALQAAKPNNTTNLADELAMVLTALYKWNSSTVAWETVVNLGEVDTSNAVDYRAATISFTSGSKTISDSANGFVTAGFRAGEQITISGSASNNATFTMVSVAAGAIVVLETVVTEAAGANVKAIATVINKIAKFNASGNLQNYTKTKKEFTASGAIAAMDSVYPSAADTVKKMYPTAMGAGAAITTSPTSNRPCKIIQISNNVILQVSGNDGNSGGAALVAQVRTLNAGETDFTYGTEASVLGTATVYFDVCQIDTSTFAVIYQKVSGGTPVGLQVVILTVSGTTITVGTPATIEAAGSTSWQCSVCKVDTLKCLITYAKDSDTKPYVQVLTVSGTTITTNTPVNMKNSGNIHRVVSNQIAAGRCILSYTDNSTQNIFCRTIDVSGTVPTVNTESAALDNQSANIYVGDVKMISATKGIITYGISTTSYIKVITLSGTGNNTITGGTATTLTATTRAPGNTYFGCVLIGSGYMMHAAYSGASTTVLVDFLSIGATTTTLISNQGLACSASTYGATCMCKISPWTYLVTGTVANSDSIIKMTPNTTRIGIAEAAIADTVLGLITMRYQTAVLSGLTAGSLYYVDDNGQPTTNLSITAPSLGVALNTTELLLT